MFDILWFAGAVAIAAIIAAMIATANYRSRKAMLESWQKEEREHIMRIAAILVKARQDSKPQ